MGRCAALAAAAWLAFCAGAARAEDIETTQPFIIDPNQRHPVLKALHVPIPPGCWATHNGYSCGSLRSECVFLFGSCRDFFGEPCCKTPPPPPWSPEANVPPGIDGPPAGSQKRCNCGW
jgi:hypothetical protein